MASTVSRTGSEFSADLSTRPSLDAMIKRPSLGKRASRSLTRFLIIFCFGVAATLAWQSYGDAAREMIANSYPQLSWLAPQAAPLAQTASDMSAPAPSADPFSRAEALKEMSLAFATVRQSVDQLAASQQQIADGIAKLVANQQELLHKISAPRPRPAPAPERKPVPLQSWRRADGQIQSAGRDASRAVKEYLATLDDAAFGAASEITPKFVSPSDPAAQWTGPMRGPPAGYRIGGDQSAGTAM